jgi:hypothetical protein
MKLSELSHSRGRFYIFVVIQYHFTKNKRENAVYIIAYVM